MKNTREQLDLTLKQVHSKEPKVHIASLPVMQCKRDSTSAFPRRYEILNKVLGRSFTIISISFIFLSSKEILACFGVSSILCFVEFIYLLAPYIWLLTCSG